MAGAEEKIEVPHFNPVEHAVRHRGVEVLTRLVEVAKTTTDQEVQRTAVSRGLELALQRPWSQYHDQLLSVAQALGIPEAKGEAARSVDEARTAHARHIRDLEEEVQAADASLSKPRIFVRGRRAEEPRPGAGRVADAAHTRSQAAYRAMAEAYAAAGEQQDAMKAYFTLKNHCTSPADFAVLCRGIVVLSLQTRIHSHVATFSIRGRSAVGEHGPGYACGGEPPAQGFAHGRAPAADPTPSSTAPRPSWRCTAATFLPPGAISSAFPTTWATALPRHAPAHALVGLAVTRLLTPPLPAPQVVLGDDVALYGVLSALASRPRAELQQALEEWRDPLSANEVARELLSDFVGARYRRCLRRLALLEVRAAAELPQGVATAWE